MMIKNIILDTLFIFLVTYALTDMIYNLIQLVSQRKKVNMEKKLTVLLDNDICNVENTIRQTAKYARRINCNFILIYDCISPENMEIVSRLSEDYPQMSLKCSRECELSEIFEDNYAKHAKGDIQ